MKSWLFLLLHAGQVISGGFTGYAMSVTSPAAAPPVFLSFVCFISLFALLVGVMFSRHKEYTLPSSSHGGIWPDKAQRALMKERKRQIKKTPIFKSYRNMVFAGGLAFGIGCILGNEISLISIMVFLPVPLLLLLLFLWCAWRDARKNTGYWVANFHDQLINREDSP